MMITPTRPPFWNIPYRQNPFFTGQEDILCRIHQRLHADSIVALSQPQAISGLGGIGKTQTAVEYAYRYSGEYEAVFWVRAESTLTIISSFLELAQRLDLPERNEQDQRIIVEAVLRWLRLHTSWLLIFDNMDDLRVAEPFVPKAGPGHLLFTTRVRAPNGLGQRLEMQPLEAETGALLLLRRANILPLQASLTMATKHESDIASEISHALDGLPLALDQAGAYIKETPCSLMHYLALYQTRRRDLLQARGSFDQDYPASVATTWSLSFEKVRQANAAAADLLHFCAFLAPDAIPEMLLTKGASHLGPFLSVIATDPHKMNLAYAEVLRYSLLQREADEEEGIVTMHRLVQAVLKDRMDKAGRQQWAGSAIATLNAVFPSPEDFQTWNWCKRLVQHALVCKTYSSYWDTPQIDLASLLVKAANYLRERAQYSEIEQLYVQAQEIAERALGSDHENVAHTLYNRAILYTRQGKYEQAEPLHLRALALLEQALGPDNPDVTHPLHGLAVMYRNQGKYEQAERLHLRTLAIREQVFGPDHAQVAASLLGLANIFWETGRYQQAEACYQHALNIQEETLGARHPRVAQTLNNLAVLFMERGQFQRAEALYQRVLQTREQALGPKHPDVAESLLNLANLYAEQDTYEQAESFYLQAQALWEEVLGPDHADIAYTLNGLAIIYTRQGRYEQAEPLYQRAAALWEQKLGPVHPLVAAPLSGLAEILTKQGRYADAEPLYLRALAIREQGRGPSHLETATSLQELACLYEEQGKVAQAREYYRRTCDLLKELFGLQHPFTRNALKSYAALLRAAGQTREAEALESRLRENQRAGIADDL